MKQRHLWGIALFCILHSFVWAAPTYDASLNLYNSGQFAQARQSFLQFAQADPADAQALEAKVYSALCLFKQNDYPAFEQEAQGLIQQNPSLPPKRVIDLQWHLTMVPFMQKKWAEARPVLAQFAAGHPDSELKPWALYHEVLCLDSLGKNDDYRQKAESFLGQYPSFLSPDQVAQTRYKIALTWFSQEKWKEAHDALRQVAADHPDFSSVTEARRFAAQCLFNQNAYDEFAQEAGAILAGNPPAQPQSLLPDLEFNLGMAPYSQKKWDQAIPRFEKYLTDYPAHPRAAEARDLIAAAHFNVAYEPFSQGKWAEAQPMLDKFVADFPKAERAAEAQADALTCKFQQNAFDDFKQGAESFFTQYPGAPKPLFDALRYKLAAIPLMQNKNEEAQASLERFISDHPDSEYVLDARGKALGCLFLQKKFDEFKAQAGPFLQQHPELAKELRLPLEYSLAMIPFEQGKWAEAASALDLFVAGHPDAKQVTQARIDTIKALYNQENYDHFKPKAEDFLTSFPQALGLEQSEELRYDLAMIPFNQKKWAEAAESLKQYAAGHPATNQAVQARFNEIKALYNQGNYDSFKPKAEDFLTSFPQALGLEQAEELRYNQAMIPFKQKKWTEASAGLEKYATDHPYSPFAMESRFNAIMAVYHGNDFDAFRPKAESFLEQFPKADKNQTNELLFNIGMTFLNQNQPAKAIEQFQKVVALNIRPTSVCVVQLFSGRAKLEQAGEAHEQGLETLASDLRRQAGALRQEACEAIPAALGGEKDAGSRHILETTALDACYKEKDYAQIEKLSRAIAGRYLSPSEDWAIGTFWYGIALMNKRPRDPAGAREAFEAILKVDTKDYDAEGGVLGTVAVWKGLADHWLENPKNIPHDRSF